MNRRIASALAFLWLLPAFAASTDPYVPPELAPWKNWVLHDAHALACPAAANAQANASAGRECAWGGPLAIQVDAQGARFTQSLRVFARTQIELPGDAKLWPQGVTVDGKPATVVGINNHPSITLEAGSYALAGRFGWLRRPETIQVPNWIGLVELTLDGHAVTRPERNEEGLWLGRRSNAGAAEEKDAIELTVYRRVEDGTPVVVTTYLEFRVSGRAREETFAHALLPGFVPLNVESELPGRFDAEGRLVLQVRPGGWEIWVKARARKPATDFNVPAASGIWPKEEVWSFRGDARLRNALLEGGAPVDPSQSGVPGEWEQDPTVQVAAGGVLKLVERSRGLSEPDALTLDRRLWLSHAGDEFTALDHVGGRMRNGWRLDMSAPWTLERAREGEDDIPITKSATAAEGVELRIPEVTLSAQLALPRSGWTLPAVGWAHGFDSANVTLTLPPGRRLLAVGGVDYSEGDWVSRWDLLDMFLGLVLTAMVWHLFGARWGSIALVAIALAFHEANAPIWALVPTFAGIALWRAVSEGRLRGFARLFASAGLATFVVLLVPFAAGQIRFALYPQLERDSYQAADREYMLDLPKIDMPVEQAEVPAAAPAPNYMSAPTESREDDNVKLDRVEVTGSRIKRTQLFSRTVPNSLVQAGSGEPSWSWNEARFGWQGPVGPDDTVRLVILPRPVTALWHLLAVLGLGLLAFVSSAALMPQLKLPGVLGRWLPSAPAVLAAFALSTALAPLGDARADDAGPRPELLTELRNRLTEAPPCSGHCAEVARATLDADANGLSLVLEIHTGAHAAVPLPEGDAWSPARVTVDGAPRAWLLRRSGKLHLELEPGVHRVELRGPLPAGTSLDLDFPLPPHAITVNAPGWQVGGVQDGRLLASNLELVRVRAGGSGRGADLAELSRVPPFVSIRRTLMLDLDWNVSTTVTRVAPSHGAFTVTVPVLEGEDVLTTGIEARDGHVVAAFDPDAEEVEWRSNLPRSAEIELTAADLPDAVEYWKIDASPIWHLEAAGVPQVMSERYEGGDAWEWEYHPLPGETLKLTLTRPDPVPGATLAIDSVDEKIFAGQRSSATSLALSYRSTRGGQHRIALPAGATLTDLKVDGDAQTLVTEAGAVPITLQPGAHQIELAWRNDDALGLLTRVPPVVLGTDARNVSVYLEIPHDRWVLFAWGPIVGPAVLYWGELALFVLVALVVARLRFTPLTARDWLLLGVGLSTWSWATLVLVAAWLHALAWRERTHASLSDRSFKLMQVALAALTIAALWGLVAAVPGALLGHPDLHVVGNESTFESLNWFADRSREALPGAGALTLPLWVYKLAILAWALWLSLALLRWLRWSWNAYAAGGHWRGKVVAADAK